MSTSSSLLHKILVCCCCSHTACTTGQCYNMWTGMEAYGLCCIQSQACCWTLCAPLCHYCKLGDTTKALDHCSKAVRYCLFCCALDCVAPCDGCYNCICYQKDNFQNGVSGFKDITKHKMWLGSKVQ